MNYLISKKKSDGRLATCGFIMPDGFFVVIGLTLSNQEQIRNVANVYDVQESKLPEGTYTPEGYRVDPESIRGWVGDTCSPLIYIDGEPVAGTLVSPKRDVRPPVHMRPDALDIEMVPESEAPLPPGAAEAIQRIQEQQAAGVKAVAAPTRAESGAAESTEILQEDDMTTLGAEGATEDAKVAMLRAALDARGIKYSPQAKFSSLQKKLQDAEVAA
jgi:hypothetical protein